MDDVSFDAFMANPSLYLTPPVAPQPGELVAWVKKRVEGGGLVTCGVEKAHRYAEQGKTLCLTPLPALSWLLPSADGIRRCSTCELYHRQGVKTIEEATILEAHRATLAIKGVA